MKFEDAVPNGGLVVSSLSSGGGGLLLLGLRFGHGSADLDNFFCVRMCDC